MNRPTNRQSRSSRGSSRGRGGRAEGREPRPSRNASSNDYNAVPTTTQVRPGTAVSIVLKQDQPSGREVQGVVQDLLTRGNHPRGIKVRLQDGRVGRVQRMVDGNLQVTSDPRQVTEHTASYIDEPPSRSLADFFPPSNDTYQRPDVAVVQCPFCTFHGDEVAVSRHVDEHITDS